MMEAWLLQIWSLRAQVVQTAPEAENPSQMATPLQNASTSVLGAALLPSQKTAENKNNGPICTSSSSANVHQTCTERTTANHNQWGQRQGTFLQISAEQGILHHRLASMTLPRITNSSYNLPHSRRNTRAKASTLALPFTACSGLYLFMYFCSLLQKTLTQNNNAVISDLSPGCLHAEQFNRLLLSDRGVFFFQSKTHFFNLVILKRLL